MASPEDAPVTHRLYTEDERGETVILTTRPYRYYRERFWTMFHSATALVATFDRPPAYHRALLHLLTVLDPIQWRRVSAREVAAGARLSAASAERALSMLEADRVILTNGAKTGAKARRINNRLAWASRADAHHHATPDPEIIDARGR